jgi:mercuric ion transport protein
VRPLPTEPAVESHPAHSGNSGRRGFLASVGAVAAALLASLCCVGPLVFVTLGVGASLASRFEPLRPVFTILTLGLLATAFYSVYGAGVAVDPGQKSGLSCGPEGACTVPRKRTRERVLLWAATLVALLLLTFPQWSLLLV